MIKVTLELERKDLFPYVHHKTDDAKDIYFCRMCPFFRDSKDTWNRRCFYPSYANFLVNEPKLIDSDLDVGSEKPDWCMVSSILVTTNDRGE